MKVRIYYDGYTDVYFCQYKKYGIWRNFKKHFYDGWERQEFSTQSEAVKFLNDMKQEYNKYRLVKLRNKKYGIIFIDVWN